MTPTLPLTLGELKASGWVSRPVGVELRDNLLAARKQGHNPFEGILGFDQSVIPDVERAILANHHMLLLGLRGQAKTRLARTLVNLLDPWMPAIKGVELWEDPMTPLTAEAKELAKAAGDDLELSWISRDARYVEKLATPDVSVADLIGDVDPIKAASMKLPYSDERVIHFGMVPRAHRGIFVINELPDLQPRIQVALFNILQEGDLQIRGFGHRLAIDVQLIFTANPEDYTSRGSIVTPLKDRIESQILTHYPKEAAIGIAITRQEARVSSTLRKEVREPQDVPIFVESLAEIARQSEWVDQKSGVSARLGISAMELLYAQFERRQLKAKTSTFRVADLFAIVPAITGKVELVYEGEQEGAMFVAHQLIGAAIKQIFLTHFTDPQQLTEDHQPYDEVISWFAGGHTIALTEELDDEAWKATLCAIPGLSNQVDAEEAVWQMELLLHGLAEFGMLSRIQLDNGWEIGDPLSDLLAQEGLE